MSNSVRRFVAFVVVSAVICAALSYVRQPAIGGTDVAAALSFAALGLLVQLLSHRTSNGSNGSIAFIPYLASIIVTTSWVSVVGITVATGLAEVYRSPGLLKASFNTSQFSLATSLALFVYVSLGGLPLLEDHSLNALPYFALVLTFFVANALLVSSVIAIANGQPLGAVLRRHTAGNVLYDILASPVAYVFGWVYATRGAGWTAGLALPLLAIRHIYKTNFDLERTHHELLQLMVKAIEARDPYTSGHSQRVANYSRIIARAIGLGTREIQKISDAALLHDVGKIHEIYAPILMKPGKLTPEEWQIMQTHPVKSEELVKTVSSLKDLLGSIRHHHENWDGTGYPDGIAGDEIPLGARVITVADTIDAMTTDRPYRQALGRAEVEAELVRLRGKQYDPVICDALIRGSHLESLIEGGASKNRTPAFSPMLVGTHAPSRRTKGPVSA